MLFASVFLESKFPSGQLFTFTSPAWNFVTAWDVYIPAIHLCQKSYRIFRVLLVELCAWAFMLTSHISPNLILAHSLPSSVEVKSECSCISSVLVCQDDVHRKQQYIYLYLYHYLRSLCGVCKVKVLYGFSRVRKVAESDHWLRHVFCPSVWSNCASTGRIVCEISYCRFC